MMHVQQVMAWAVGKQSTACQSEPKYIIMATHNLVQ